MYCCISKQIPENPVISKKSGHLYEKRLIVKYIEENGTDPITGEALSVEDLQEVKTSTTSSTPAEGEKSNPRTNNTASIPGMLQMFQNEWDSLMLETFTLRQHLETVRQELSHALYQHDAACRVIARLIKERDEAKMALVKTGTSAPSAAPAFSTMTSSTTTNTTTNSTTSSNNLQDPLPQDVIGRMIQTSERLTAKRKKRKVSKTLTAPDAIGQLHLSSVYPVSKSQVLTCIDIHPSSQNLILLGSDSDAFLFDTEQGRILQTLGGHQKSITDVLFHPELDIIFTSSEDNYARIFARGDNQQYKLANVLNAQKESVTRLTLQPSGQYLCTSSMDGSWAFYDITSATCLHQTEMDAVSRGYSCVNFHPDGLILGTGAVNGSIKIWDIKTQQSVKTLKEHSGKITDLSFSENGYYMASASVDGSIKFWDLRKLAAVSSVDLGSPVNAVKFDASGVYIAASTTRGVKMYQSKVWTELLSLEEDHKDSVTDIVFGTDARNIYTCSLDKNLRIFSVPDGMQDDQE